MELIYAYIKNYRCFENQSISFSDKFNVNYDVENSTIKIERNDKQNYNFYPHHISNVSAIVGKNGVGKTSLVSLCCNSINMRLGQDGIFDYNQKKYTQSFFLLYYYKIEDGCDYFVFEAPPLEEHDKLFNNIPTDHYYVEHNWRAFICKNEESKLTFIKNVHDAGIEEDVSILRFIEMKKKKGFSAYNDVSKEENRVVVQRRTYDIFNEKAYDAMSFIIEQLKHNTRKTNLFLDDAYTLSIEYGLSYWLKEVIDTYEQNVLKGKLQGEAVDMRKVFPSIPATIDKNPNQVIVICFLNEYLQYFCFDALLHRETDIKIIEPVLKEIIPKFAEIDVKEETYEAFYDAYKKRIEVAFSLWNDEFGCEPVSFSKFERALNALEKFLKYSNQNRIKIDSKIGSFSITVTKESNITFAKDFFDCFVDERVNSNEDDGDMSVMDTFLSYEIEHLSGGEGAFISLLSSVHKAITAPNYLKNEFILFFDEIEKSFHPDYCRQLLNVLFESLQTYQGKRFQIVISTHSPFVVGDIPSANIIRLTRTKCEKTIIDKPETQTFAQNIHTLLKQPFFMDNTLGAYSIQLIETILAAIGGKSYLEAKNILKNRMDIEVRPLEQIKEGYIEEQIRDIWIKSLENCLLDLINHIGEPVLRNELMKRFEQCGFYSLDEKIKKLRKQLSELEAQRQ